MITSLLSRGDAEYEQISDAGGNELPLTREPFLATEQCFSLPSLSKLSRKLVPKDQILLCLKGSSGGWGISLIE